MPARVGFATRPVLLVGAAVVVGLLLLAPAYGFHRDELYFIAAGRHPALGYDDQPPLTPLLSAAAVALLGPQPWAVRVLPAIAVGLVVLLTAGIARELGATRRGQVLAALVIAASGYLAAGHLGVTATYDLPAWAAILWLVAGLLRGEDPRRWLLVGLVAGLALWNKHLVLFLAGGLAVGLLVHRRDLVRSPWPWAAAALAVGLWLPNLAWQVANGLPQLEMARSIGEAGGGERPMVVVELLLLVGPLLFPVALIGLWRLVRAPSLVAFRALGTTFLAILAVVLLVGGKSYYVIGAVPPLMAAGAMAVDGWIGRGAQGGRRRAAAFGGLATASAVIVALLTLPVLPAATLASTPIPEIYGETAETVGWPELVATVEGVVDGLTREERSRAVVLTANYGEAGALMLFGRDLPPVVSGHNAVWRWAAPPDTSDVTVLVGWWGPDGRAALFSRCAPGATIRNEAGMPNEEQGAGVWVCAGSRIPWSRQWPRLRHLD
jgi:4-amino-4-deoxy-L-arabinose transferase-like glycosyltransferase